MNSEKFYVQLLNKTIATYLTNLPDDLQLAIAPYLRSIKEILQFHSNIFYPKLQECNGKATAICDTFKAHIENLDFKSYQINAAYVTEAQKLIENYNKENVRKNDGTDCPANVEVIIFAIFPED